jgi:hypothetical protein
MYFRDLVVSRASVFIISLLLFCLILKKVWWHDATLFVYLFFKTQSNIFIAFSEARSSFLHCFRSEGMPTHYYLNYAAP